jgi:hypothetical protein
LEYVSAPIAFVPNEPERNVQLAPLPERALFVLQMPPPAAPAQTVHFDCEQFGSTASAVTRPEAV